MAKSKVAVVAAVGLAGALWAAQAGAYPMYDDGFGTGCVLCHVDFKGGPQQVLHAVHTNNFGITECNLCHPNGPGSKPVRTYTSGPGGGLGCAGCHGRDYGEISPNSGQPKATGYGLRQVHANHGVTVCATCHQPGQLGHPDPFPPILPENVPPPYYGQPTNTLTNPCASFQEDSGYDTNTVGLDNDGDGAADWPADADCAMPTTTTTSTSTTTTTLPVSCDPQPLVGCVAPAKSVLLVNEKKAGKEKIKVALKKLQSVVSQSDFGDPVAGTTNYTICIYDDTDALVGELSVSRAGDLCSGKFCWNAISTKGYKYIDKLTQADGVLKMILVGGNAGKGKTIAIAKNNAPKGLNFMPTGIAPALLNATHATVQILTSDAACFGATVTSVKKADGSIFKATGP